MLLRLSLLFIIPNVTTAGNFATNLLAKYRGNILASNSFQQQCCLVYDGLYVPPTKHIHSMYIAGIKCSVVM